VRSFLAKEFEFSTLFIDDNAAYSYYNDEEGIQRLPVCRKYSRFATSRALSMLFWQKCGEMKARQTTTQ
jgi:hypothetical protein